jgi:hypothetical protein
MVDELGQMGCPALGFGSLFLNSPHCLVKHPKQTKNSKKILCIKKATQSPIALLDIPFLHNLHRRTQIGVLNRGPKSGSQIGVPNWGPKLGSQIGVPKSGSQIRVPNRGPKHLAMQV